MKVPERIVPLLFVLLLVAAFLLGRYQAQVEILRGGVSPQVVSQQGGTSQAAGQTATQQTAPGGDTRTVIPDELWNEVISKSAAEKGSADAPVTMVEFTDYQCPFCARYFSDTQPQIDKEYIDTGKVRYLVRDLPLPIHPNAPAAAQAARCAGDQGKYWEMHDALYEKQSEWSSGDTGQLFSAYASGLGLSGGDFSACLSSAKYKAAVDEDLALAQQVGARGTPAFVINGELLIGAQPFQAFQQVIERGL